MSGYIRPGGMRPAMPEDRPVAIRILSDDGLLVVIAEASLPPTAPQTATYALSLQVDITKDAGERWGWLRRRPDGGVMTMEDEEEHLTELWEIAVPISEGVAKSISHVLSEPVIGIVTGRGCCIFFGHDPEKNTLTSTMVLDPRHEPEVQQAAIRIANDAQEIIRTFVQSARPIGDEAEKNLRQVFRQVTAN